MHHRNKRLIHRSHHLYRLGRIVKNKKDIVPCEEFYFFNKRSLIVTVICKRYRNPSYLPLFLLPFPPVFDIRRNAVAHVTEKT